MGIDITYTRSGGRGTPPESESITVHGDGTFEAQRSVNAPSAGRFAGTLHTDLAARLASAAAAADGVAAPAATLMPGAPRETIRVGDGAATDVSRQSGPPWSDLRAALADALDAAVASPADAVRLVVSTDPPAARVETVGDAAVAGGASVLAVLWSAEWEERARAEATLADSSVTFDSFAPSDGDRLQVTVTAKVTITGRERNVQLVAEAVASR